MNPAAAPAALLLVLGVAAAVVLGGAEGAGLAALLGSFLVGLGLLLFRRSAHSAPRLRGDRTRNPRRDADAQFLGFLVLAGVFLRVGLALALRATDLNRVVAPDEFTFHDNGVWFKLWLDGEVDRPFSWRFRNSTQVGYFAVVGTLYDVFGIHEIVPVLVNCVVGALCAFPGYRLAARVGGRRAGRAAAVLLTFFPSLVLWSALLLRDPLVLWFLLWSACLAQSLLERFRLRASLLLVACLAGIATLRSYLFLMLAVCVVGGFLLAGIRRPGRAVAAAVAGGLGALLLLRVAGLGAEHLREASLEAIALQRQLNAYGAGGIELGGHDVSTPAGALAYLPMGIAWFLFSPFPWQFGGKQGLAMPDVLLWYACVPYVVRGALYGLRRRRRSALVPLLAAGLVTLFYALVEGNVGIIFRHRAQVLVLFLPFAGVGFARARRLARAAVPGATRAAAAARARLRPASRATVR